MRFARAWCGGTWDLNEEKKTTSTIPWQCQFHFLPENGTKPARFHMHKYITEPTLPALLTLLTSLLSRLSAPVHQRDHLQNQTRKHRATMNFSFSNIPVGNPPFF
jgi:hypothetical protein